MARLPAQLTDLLHRGVVIPAHPLALTEDKRLDERGQAALTRYYCDAGVGGIAVGVHTTQFEIHDPAVGLYEPVLALAAAVADEWLGDDARPFVKVAGLIGPTAQATREAALAVDLGYDAGLLSLAAHRNADDATLLAHCRAVAEIMPVVGFYLQPAVGGRVLSYGFWRAFAEIDNVVAIKIAPFNRYQTLDVVRAVADAGRGDRIALYTGNDDNIVNDLITDFTFGGSGNGARRPAGDAAQDGAGTASAAAPLRIVGGLLGQWAVWAHQAVVMLDAIHAGHAAGTLDYAHWLRYNVHLTDANAAIFDAANSFRGCIPGINYVLARQGLVQGPWSLNPHEVLSPGQVEAIEQVYARYPHLHDDEFVETNRARWFDRVVI